MKIGIKTTILVVLVVVVAIFNAASFVDPVFSKDDIEETKDDIKDVEKDIEKEEKEYENLSKTNATVSSQINTTKGLINKTQGQIKRKEIEIEDLKKRIALSRSLLQDYLRELYWNRETDDLIEMVVFKDSWQKIVSQDDSLLTTKDKILSLVDEIKKSKAQLEDDKEELGEKKDEHEKLLAIKENQQAEIKREMLSTQAELSDLRSKLSKLRSRYSELLGKSVSTDDILKAAKYAAKKTGISKSFLLAVLVQESNKGQSTGTCNYKESKMSDYRKKIFKDICEDLGYNYKKQKVSCPPKGYKGTGGAMGVAQFMPDTWRGYESRIRNLTGSKHPDPWDLTDGVTAMAIKLANDGANKKKRFYEAKAYCVYLAGGNWGYYCFGKDKYDDDYEDVNCWGSSIKNYGERILCLKDNYEKYY